MISPFPPPTAPLHLLLHFGATWLAILVVLIGTTTRCVETNNDAALYDDSNVSHDEAYAQPDEMRYGAEEPCYHSSGKVKFCEPEFLNLAKEKRVIASSTCIAKLDDEMSCSDESGPGLGRRLKPYRADYLTDSSPHSFSKTCWASKSLRGSNISHVNLTINFHKKNIIHYMSLADCGRPLPDNLEVLKSVDYGESWQRWHLFSKNCERDFGMVGKAYQFKEKIGSKEVVCTNINVDELDSQLSKTLSFSTNFNRVQGGLKHENDPIYIDWMTATDIKIVMRKSPNNKKDYDKPFSFSNIDIGGRCFCNGHASRCVHRNGRATCDCKHGTEGDDCERCREFWVDLPWKRGTHVDPGQCKACNCNKHSETCRFSPELYKSTNFVSGGYCVNCRDNTAGHHCHECRSGFYRNSTKNIDDNEVCLVCNCHPLGSITNICDRMTGKCQCKIGVAGEKCDRCIPGYIQTLVHNAPCRKESKINEKICPARCRSADRRLTRIDYCVRQVALSVRITQLQFQLKWIKVTAQMKDFIKCHNCNHMTDVLTFWIKKRNWHCNCPAVRRGNAYLIITRDKRHPVNKNDLILDKRSIVWQWESALSTKIKNFDYLLSQNTDSCQDCDCINQKQQQRKSRRRKGKQQRARQQRARQQRARQQRARQQRARQQRARQQRARQQRARPGTSSRNKIKSEKAKLTLSDYAGKGSREKYNSNSEASFGILNVRKS